MSKRCNATVPNPVNATPAPADYRCDLEEGHEGYHFAAGYPWSGWKESPDTPATPRNHPTGTNTDV